MGTLSSMTVSLDGALDGETNMARDVSLLMAAEGGEAGARIYAWDGPWLSLGRFQRPEQVLAEMGDLPWVLRPTGGKAVRHCEDVTVAIAVPLGTLALSNRQVKESYRALANPVIAGLRATGIPAILAEDTRWCKPCRESRTVDCFAHASPNDIVDNEIGKKLCGCALRLTERAVLLQASIPGSSEEQSTRLRESLASQLKLQMAAWNQATQLCVP